MGFSLAALIAGYTPDASPMNTDTETARTTMSSETTELRVMPANINERD